MSDVLPAKLYFRIGEVAGLVGVEPHVLRYWEREFRSIRPSKSAKGQRVYSRRDVENLLRVRDLLYGQGFTIAGAKKRMRDKEPDPTADLSPMEPVAQENPLRQPEPREASATHLILRESAVQVVGPPVARDRIRVRLEELKTEIEAFLEELGT